jgi:uncharacterized protein (TIGR03437 family)
LAWREPAKADAAPGAERERNARLAEQLNGPVTTSTAAGDYLYVGFADGRIGSSSDRGANWSFQQQPEMGRIERIVVDPADPRLALAAVGTRPAGLSAQIKGAHILRTINGGRVWDDLTADLPDAALRGVAFERGSGAIYVAGDRGIFWTRTDLLSVGQPTAWQVLGGGLPGDAPAVDVRLDAGGNQVYAGLLGYGIYSTSAPHRRGAPRLVNAADYSTAIRTAVSRNGQSSSDLAVPILASSESRSEIQIPFEARPGPMTLLLDSGQAILRFGLPIESASPAIFVDRNGTPMLLDSDSGILLDSMAPAHSGGRLQILATGLGRVNPEWPAGMKAPAENPPAVAGVVRAFLDGAEAGVIRSVLAPGYVGFYLVEVQLPSIVNYGPAELAISVDGKESNRVRVYVEP